MREPLKWLNLKTEGLSPKLDCKVVTAKLCIKLHLYLRWMNIEHTLWWWCMGRLSLGGMMYRAPYGANNVALIHNVPVFESQISDCGTKCKYLDVGPTEQI